MDLRTVAQKPQFIFPPRRDMQHSHAMLTMTAYPVDGRGRSTTQTRLSHGMGPGEVVASGCCASPSGQSPIGANPIMYSLIVVAGFVNLWGMERPCTDVGMCVWPSDACTSSVVCST